MPQYFRNVGFPCPASENPAVYFCMYIKNNNNTADICIGGNLYSVLGFSRSRDLGKISGDSRSSRKTYWSVQKWRRALQPLQWSIFRWLHIQPLHAFISTRSTRNIVKISSAVKVSSMFILTILSSQTRKLLSDCLGGIFNSTTVILAWSWWKFLRFRCSPLFYFCFIFVSKSRQLCPRPSADWFSTQWHCFHCWVLV